MLKELRNQHRTIIQMVFAGFKNNDIAERLEMSPTTVSQIIRSPLGQAYLEGLQDKAQEATLDVRKKLVSLNSSALTVLERIMNPAEKAPHSVQLTAAKDVLDRTGYKAPDRLHVDMTMQTKTDQEIDAEINAVQQSIAKTYLQDPNKVIEATETTCEDSNIPFTDEQPEQKASQDKNKNMDSSGQLVKSSQSSIEQYVLNGIDNDSPNLSSFASTPEESITEQYFDQEFEENPDLEIDPDAFDLLSNIPADLFQQSR